MLDRTYSCSPPFLGALPVSLSMDITIIGGVSAAI